jgi:shikimate kinase
LADRLLLIGMMASGKTTVGRLVAERLGWGYLDSDEQVCERTGRSVREIFEQDGEVAFRREERLALEAAIADDQPRVISVAGGAVLDVANRDLLRRAGTVAWLRADPAVLAARVEASGQGHRPLLGDDPKANLTRLDAERRPIYEALAEIVVDVEGRTPAEIADHLVQELSAGTAS